MASCAAGTLAQGHSCSGSGHMTEGASVDASLIHLYNMPSSRYQIVSVLLLLVGCNCSCAAGACALPMTFFCHQSYLAADPASSPFVLGALLALLSPR